MLWELLAADIERIEGIGAVGSMVEKVFFGLRLFSPQKVQMKRSATGGEADGCCPQRKSHCPTLVGRNTKALSEKADSDGFRFNAKYTFCLIWLLCTRYELLQALQ